jgi:transposase
LAGADWEESASAETRVLLAAVRRPYSARELRQRAQLAVSWTGALRWAMQVTGFDSQEDYEFAAELGARYATMVVFVERFIPAEIRKQRERLHRQGVIAAYLMMGHSKREAAERAGISRGTLLRWEKEDPFFRRGVKEAQRNGAEGPFVWSSARARHPTKMSLAVRLAIVEGLRQGMTRSQAATAAGVSKQTFYTWLRRRPEFEEMVVVAEREA